jgi:lysophospholipase L1-like esterase/pimeloyl-ACP methyl ester carboxylesterase
MWGVRGIQHTSPPWGSTMDVTPFLHILLTEIPPMKILSLITLLFSLSGAFAQQSDYHGFKCLDFIFEGHDAKIVFPAQGEEGRHWIWRARFWGHEPQTEIALLKKGFHLVYVDAADYRANAEAVSLWNRFYDYVLQNYHLNPKTVLEGFSRGGLYVYNWGSANTDKVACIYADAPVCDLRSWPGGKGKGKGSPEEWQEHLKAYHLTEQAADTFKGMPIYNCVKLAQAHVPVLHVCGAVDDVVPVDENTYVLEKNFKAAGGNIKIILKEGIGHHPHSLKDPAPIVRFILSNTSPALLDPPVPVESLMSIRFRSTMDNCRAMFGKQKRGRVAFLGGSITYNPGWRNMVCEYLQKRFPGTSFDVVAAGIPSLGSTPDAMRFSRDVLSKGKVDLLFVEAAVNDATNGVTPERQLRGMEGIIAQALRSNPAMDIVMLHFADRDMMGDYNNGRVPAVIQQHEKVADYYGVNSINLAKEVNDRVLNGEFTWRDDFKDVHPSPFGQDLYFRTIKHLCESLRTKPLATHAKARVIPQKPLDPYSYIHGRFEPISKAKIGEGWVLVRNWKPSDSAGTREGFVNVDVLESSVPGSLLTLDFKGRAIGLLVTSGPDAGIVEYSVDGAPYAKADQYTQWSKWLHLPWVVMLDDQLQDGKHRLTLRISAEKNPQSLGTVCRIQQFVAN